MMVGTTRIEKIKIEYILDKENRGADALSRRSNYIKIKERLNTNILKIKKDGLLLAM